MEEVQIQLTDALYTIMVEPAVAARMRSDNTFALNILSEALACSEEGQGETGGPGETGAQEVTSPARKRICDLATPESFKKGSCLKSSTLMTSKKSLTYPTNPTCLKFSKLPRPFMERVFRTFLEKTRKKKNVKETVVGCAYNRDLNYAIVEFTTPVVAKQMIENEFIFMHTSLTVEEVEAANEDEEMLYTFR